MSEPSFERFSLYLAKTKKFRKYFVQKKSAEYSKKLIIINLFDALKILLPKNEIKYFSWITAATFLNTPNMKIPDWIWNIIKMKYTFNSNPFT